MNKEPFKIDFKNKQNGDMVARYCINRLAELNGGKPMLKTMFKGGGIGGDVAWGIHKSDKYVEEDYGVKPFEGWRFYLDTEESPTSELIDCLLSERAFISLLENAFPQVNVKEIASDASK